MIRRLALVCAALLAAGPAVAAPKCLASASLSGLGIALPHLAADLAAGRVPVIVAIGSSSTQGVGASRPERSYPARLAIELRQRHRIAAQVLNKGIGGEGTAETLRRFETDVAAYRPALVIWQAGSNTALRNDDLEGHRRDMRAGIDRLHAIGADVVVMTPQYAPAMIAAPRHLEIVAQLADLADKAETGIFRRFEIMRAWKRAGIGFPEMLSPDGLHMNDWSYGCTARLLADAIAAGVKAKIHGPLVSAR